MANAAPSPVNPTGLPNGWNVQANGNEAVTGNYPSTTEATFNGSTDDHTALIQAQINNNLLQLPNGTASIGGTVTMNQNGLYIHGAGMYNTILQASVAETMLLYGASYVSDIEITDLTLDGNNLATLGLGSYGNRIGRLTIRRCRFINFPGVIIEAGYAANYIIEDCVAEGGGLGVATFFLATNQPFESLVLRRNRLRCMYQGITLGSSGYHTAYVEITDNDIDGGWYLFTAAYANSGSSVTYTSTGLADTSASFGTIPHTSPSARYVRALNPRQTSAFTTTSGTYITDTSATFVTNGVMRGEIIRSGTAFAVVAKVISETALHVEEWLSQTTFLPVVPPIAGAAYTVYAVYLGCITASTATTITVEHGQGGGGGGWFDLSGAAQTPPSGCLYEVLSASGGYNIFLTGQVEKVIVSRNRVRRGRYDNVELFGNQMNVTDNIVEDGQDEGIVISGANCVVQGNLLSHNGSSGLDIGSASNIEVGPNQYYNNCWVQVSTNNVGQLAIYNAANVTVTGGRATYTTEATPTVGLNIEGASVSGVVVIGFTGISHSLGDVYVWSNVPAAACDLLDITGVITYQGTSNGQRIRVKGAGAPSLVAAPGSLYMNTTGGAGVTEYVKESGNGTAGWTSMATASSGGSLVGQQAAYAAVTSNQSYAVTTSYTAFTGAPSITLPNTGYTYKIELSIPLVEVSVAAAVDFALATSATGVLNAITSDIVAASRQYNIFVTAQSVVGSGQTITLYALASSASTVTIYGGAGGASSIGPIELAAYRVL